MQHLLLDSGFAIEERLHGCFTLTVAPRMWSGAVVGINPMIHILLQLFHARVKLLAKDNLIKLFQTRAVKPLTDAIDLGGFGLGPSVVNVLNCQVQLVLVMLDVAAVL